MSRFYQPSRRPGGRGVLISVVLVFVLLIFATALVVAQVGGPTVTAVSGPSWLDAMGLSFEGAALGRAGVLGASSEDIPGPEPDLSTALREGFVVDGEDLYRYNCRSCHGAKGAGLPPAILPLSPAVRATSEMLQHRLIEDPKEADERAKAADATLRQRLISGGVVMPKFDHISPDEIPVLLSYLEVLTEVPDASSRLPTLQRSLERVGEHIVKGTCHQCHGATEASRGPTGSAQFDSLATLVSQYGLANVMAMNKHAVVGGTERPRGPSLIYFRDSELAAAYIYLAAHPPEN